MPLTNQSILNHYLLALHQIHTHHYLIVTKPNSTTQIHNKIKTHNFELFINSKHDVLQHYTNTTQYTNTNTIIRTTNNTPLMSTPLTNRILQHHTQINTNLNHYLKIPLNTNIEIISTAALQTTTQNTIDPIEHKHLTQHLYHNPKHYHVIEPLCPHTYQNNTHITINNKPNYTLIKQIYTTLYQNHPIKTQTLIQ